MKKTEKPSTIEQLKSILALPFIVIAVIPTLIYFFIPDLGLYVVSGWNQYIIFAFGILFFLIGLPLFIQSIILFVKIGKGTLAPWNPTKKLVVRGLYRHMRNPMILGVCIILLSESFLLKSLSILLWSLTFFLLNHLYFIFKEEPDLYKRFGEEYREYCKNVPRWIPGIKGWKPEEKPTQMPDDE